MFTRKLSFLFILFMFGSCIEPIDDVVGDYQNLLVVDGFISNECVPYTVKLSRSLRDVDEVITPVVLATVYVEDSDGKKAYFEEDAYRPGTYIINDDSFIGVVGKSYRLSVKTFDKKEYESKWCVIYEPTPIDSIYFEAEEYYSNQKKRYINGCRILINGHGSDERSSYLRWSFDEDWKFRIPYPSIYHFNPIDHTLGMHDPDNVYCFKSGTSNGLLFHSFENQTTNEYLRKKINLIRPLENDRISIRYRINVKQHSISKEEFVFWKNLHLINEDVGDIFGRQPFSIQSNMYCKSDINEPVLGYFQVSGISTEQFYIDNYDLFEKNIPFKSDFFNCLLDTVVIDSVNFKEVYDIYEMYVLNGGSALTGILMDTSGFSMIGLTLAPMYCQDCSYSGSIDPPNGWIDKD